MRKRLASTLAPLVAIAGLWSPFVASAQSVTVTLTGGDRIKLACSAGAGLDDPCRSVYYYGADGKRYVFPNSKTYFSWYADFNGIKTVSSEQLGGIAIGGNATYRAGGRMVKITTDPTVYVVSKNGILRSVPSEAIASSLYGSNWNQQIDDVPDAFFINYKVGSPLASASEYEKALLASAVPNINTDKLLVDPPNGFVDVRTDGFHPTTPMIVVNGAKVTWISLDNTAPRVVSDPQSALPGLDSDAKLKMGGSYSYTFNAAGNVDYMDANMTSHKGKIVVQP